MVDYEKLYKQTREELINQIAELEKDKENLIKVIRCKADFHSTKDAMRIMELESMVPKKGKIIDTCTAGIEETVCSLCRHTVFNHFNFCPNCGADFRKIEENKS